MTLVMLGFFDFSGFFLVFGFWGVLRGVLVQLSSLGT